MFMFFSVNSQRLNLMTVEVKVSFQPMNMMNTGQGAHLPLETNGPDSIFALAVKGLEPTTYVGSITTMYFLFEKLIAAANKLVYKSARANDISLPEFAALMASRSQGVR